MSATFETEKFAEYFKYHSRNIDLPAPTLFISKENQFSTMIYYIDELNTIGPVCILIILKCIISYK